MRLRVLFFLLSTMTACATTESARAPTATELEAQRKKEADAQKQAQIDERKKIEAELVDQLAAGNLIEMKAGERARFRARMFHQIAQVRLGLGELDTAVEAIESACEEAKDAGEDAFEEKIAKSRYLIHHYAALQLARNGQDDRALEELDRMMRFKWLTPAQKDQLAGDRLLLLETREGAGESKEQSILLAVARLIGADPAARKNNENLEFDPEKLRQAISDEIGREVVSASLPSARDTPAAATGDIDPTIIVQVVSSNRKSISTCYNQSLKGGKALEGKLELDVTIEPDGSVSGSEIKTQQFRSTPLGKCIAEAVTRWRFPPFAGEPQLLVLPFVLSYLN